MCSTSFCSFAKQRVRQPHLPTKACLRAVCGKHFWTSGSQMSFQYLQLSICIAVTLVGLPLDMQQSWVVKCKTIIAYLPFDLAASQVCPPNRHWRINTSITKHKFIEIYISAAISMRICYFLSDLFASYCCGKYAFAIWSTQFLNAERLS